MDFLLFSKAEISAFFCLFNYIDGNGFLFLLELEYVNCFIVRYNEFLLFFFTEKLIETKMKNQNMIKYEISSINAFKLLQTGFKYWKAENRTQVEWNSHLIHIRGMSFMNDWGEMQKFFLKKLLLFYLLLLLLLTKGTNYLFIPFTNGKIFKIKFCYLSWWIYFFFFLVSCLYTANCWCI